MNKQSNKVVILFLYIIEQEAHQMAIEILAEFTAVTIQLFHKISQLILLEKHIPATIFSSKAAVLGRYVNSEITLHRNNRLLRTKYSGNWSLKWNMIIKYRYCFCWTKAGQGDLIMNNYLSQKKTQGPKFEFSEWKSNKGHMT